MSTQVIGSEDGDTLWLRGHITDRDERRRHIETSEWATDLNFMGAVKAARTHQYVWMKKHDEPHSYWQNEYWSEVPEDTPGAEPWTRIELPTGWENWI